MTRKLSFGPSKLGLSIQMSRLGKEVEMVVIECLWCESEVRIEPRQMNDEISCPECRSSWVFEDESESELALAA